MTGRFIGAMTPTRFQYPSIYRLALIGLFLLALALRLWGIAFGLPVPYHPDEPAFVLQALAVARGVPNGITFANPPLFKYLLLSEYAVTYAVGRIGGLYASPQDFVNLFRADPTLLYLIARVTSAIVGAVTILIVYALAARVRGRNVALLAAGLSAVTYLLVRESHFGVNDALLTLMTTSALYAALRVLQNGARRDYVFAGVAIGLSFSAKYTGLVALLPLMLAHALRSERRTRDLLYALGAAAGAIMLSFPSLLFETARVLNDINIHLYRPGQIGYAGMDPAGGYVYYLKVLAWGMGVPSLVAALLGVGLALRRGDRAALVVASLPLALYAFMGYERMFFARFMLPAVPALMVFAAVALHQSSEWLPRVIWRRIVVAAAVILLGAPTLLDAVRFDMLLTQTDTRTQARDWIESNLRRGTNIALDWFPFAPELSPDDYHLSVANGWALADRTLDDYRARGVEYLLTSSYVADQWLLDVSADAQRQAFYGALHSRVEKVVEFRPYVGGTEPAFVYDEIYAPFVNLDRLTRPGPTIVIYRLSVHEANP